MRFIDDQNPHVPKGSEYRTARAYDNVDIPARGRLPRIISLAFREGRMEYRNAIAESVTKPGGGLGSQ